MNAAPPRRERLRAATLDEIRQTARKLLVRNGIAGVSLRAIAREMGMTAPGLYRYFPGLDQLLAALCAGLYDEVTGHLERTRDAWPPHDPAGRLDRVFREFRRWSVAHPAEFGLLFGAPVNSAGSAGTGSVPRRGNAAEVGGDPALGPMVADGRFAGVFAALFIEVWRESPFPVPPAEQMVPTLREQLDGYLAGLGVDLPVGAAQVFLSWWIRLYSIVALEVFGHLHFLLTDPEAMFEAELLACLRQARLPRRR